MNPSRSLTFAFLTLATLVGCHSLTVNRSVTGDSLSRDEVRFTSGDLAIAGTITRRVGGRDCPGVVLLHAAGLHARRDYQAFADSLATHGIVVLAYDMRGTGDSEGAPTPASFEEQAQDARAALEILRSQSDVDGRQVGLWALSRGGYVAPIVAVADPKLAFLIVISSPGLPVAVSDSSARVDMARDAGSDARDIARVERFVGALLQAARDGGSEYERLQQEFGGAEGESWFAPLQVTMLPPEQWLTQYGRVLGYDPDSLWRRVRTPTLLIYGAGDVPRLVQDSRSRILSALAASGARVDAPVFSNADHLLRVPGADGERRFVEGFFDVQQNWIGDVIRRVASPDHRSSMTRPPLPLAIIPVLNGLPGTGSGRPRSLGSQHLNRVRPHHSVNGNQAREDSHTNEQRRDGEESPGSTASIP